MSKRPRSGLTGKLAFGLGVVALADQLFLDQAVGLSAVAFLVVLVLACLHGNLASNWAPMLWPAVMTGVGALALAETVSWLSLSVAGAGLIGLALAGRPGQSNVWPAWVSNAWPFLVRGVWKIPSDVRRSRRLRRMPARRAARWGLDWLLPVLLAVAFLALFWVANPLLADWVLAWLDLSGFREITVTRVCIWLLAAMAVWRLLRQTGRLCGRARPGVTTGWLLVLFSAPSVRRSLLVSNLIFAVQTVLDGLYLWGGRALPTGLTYADYAHRGAYPLVAAALLAAVFILIAFRDGVPWARDRWVRFLVLAWIGQTILLVGSAMWRNYLYVEVYSLTYLRLAAGIWMGLVALGLGWILMRIALGKANAWLVRVNLGSLLAVIVVACFVDFGGAIAWFNVRHSGEAGGKGRLLDIDYVRDIGPAALPALRWYRSVAMMDVDRQRLVGAILGKLEIDLTAVQGDWRSWTFRRYRLARLVNKPEGAKAQHDGEGGGNPGSTKWFFQGEGTDQGGKQDAGFAQGRDMGDIGLGDGPQDGGKAQGGDGAAAEATVPMPSGEGQGWVPAAVPGDGGGEQPAIQKEQPGDKSKGSSGPHPKPVDQGIEGDGQAGQQGPQDRRPVAAGTMPAAETEDHQGAGDDCDPDEFPAAQPIARDRTGE